MKAPDIRWRVLFVALVPAVIIGLTLTLYLIVLRYNDADATLQGRGAALARQLAPAAEFGAFSSNFLELRRLAGSVAQEADVSAVSFYDAYGDLLVSVGTPHFAENVANLPDGWQGKSADGGTLFFHAKILRAPQRFDDPFAQIVIGPANTDTRSTQIGSVTIEMSRRALVAGKKETLLVTILIFLATLAVGSLLGRRLSRDVTEPIRSLQETVGAIHDGNLEARVTPHPGGTLHRLEEGINAMASSLLAGRDHLEARIAEATQELRQKKEEAERISQAKSRFLAAASHDLRQPLHALALFATEFEQQPHSMAQERILQQIGSAVDALNVQFKALLDISRIDLGDIVAQPEDFPIGPLIERIVAVYEPEARAKGLRLRHTGTALWCRSDPRLLERMLGNLLSNAIRYTRSGGIVVGVRRRGTELRLNVADTGIGIGAAQLPLIFQEFYQVGNPERDAENGLGLGLSIVSRLAAMLGHRIQVSSHPGRGTVFSIALQRAMPMAHTGIIVEPRRAGLFGFDIDVLVFDDAGEQRSDLCDLLENWGCRALCAENFTGNDRRIDIDPAVIICSAHHVAAARAFLARYNTTTDPPLVILLGEGCNNMPHCHPLALPLRPARLRALLQQLLLSSEEAGAA